MTNPVMKKYVVLHTKLTIFLDFQSVFDPEENTKEFKSDLIAGVKSAGWFRTRDTWGYSDTEIDLSVLRVYQKPFVLVPPSDDWKIKDV